MATSSEIVLPLDSNAQAIPLTAEKVESDKKCDSSKVDTDTKVQRQSTEKKSNSTSSKSPDTPTGSSRTHFHNSSTSSHSNPHLHDKKVNGVKHFHYNDSKENFFGNALTPESWIVTSENQILFECCQYGNGFRTCGNIRNFQRNSGKVNGNYAGGGSHLYSHGLPGRPDSNPQQYVVDLHINPGETISFDMGDHIEIVQGPATVRMVSNNNTPPVPMPVQVPPGHMVQQIVDENGTLRHIILSPQPPLAVSSPVGNPYNGPGSGNVSLHVGGSAPFYLYPNTSYSLPPHFPPHMQSGLGGQGLHPGADPCQLHQNGHSCSSGISDSSSSQMSFKDERTQRQFFKLKKRLESRQKDSTPHSSTISNQESTLNSNENLPAEESSSKKISEKDALIVGALSTIKVHEVSEVTSTSALIEWKTPDLKSENDSEINLTELSYNLFLWDKLKEAKSKLIYSGKENKFLINSLKPATFYIVQIQAKLNNLIGNISENEPFKSLSSKPDAPSPPKLVSRTKTSISLKWNAAMDNGAKISSYALEYDEGSSSDDFVDLFDGLQKQYKAVKLKESTCYRFRLAAVNEHGKSEYSAVVCFSTSGSAPSQPSPPILKEAYINRLRLEWELRPNDDNYTLHMEDEKTLHGFLPVYNGKDTSYTCLRLIHNTSYKFRLGASNEEGTSPWSQVVSYSTLPDRPGKPGKPSLKGKCHSTFFKVDWDSPKEDGGCPITDYSLEIDKGNGFVLIYNGEEREYQCENLQPGTTYSLRVQCTSLGGKSDFSDVGITETTPVIPGKCAPPKVQGKPKASSVQLKWLHPDYDGGSEILDSEIEVTHPDDSTRLAYKGSATECVVAGLLPGRLYRFRLRAYNKVGAGAWSDVLEASSGAGTAEAPAEVQAVPRSPHTVLVSWTEPFHNGAPVTEYRLECRCTDKDFELVYSGSSCSTEVKSLIPASIYHFQVQAVNSAGAGSFSGTVSCQTPASSPSSVSTGNIKTIVGATTITLSWKEPNSHGSPVLSYSIEVGDSLHTTDGDSPEICIEGLSPETAYKVRIQALNSVGPGPFSSPMKIVTRGLPPLPPILECCSYSHNSLRLKWGDGKNLEMKTFTLELESPQAKRFIPVYQGPGHSFKVTKLQELTSYSFRIFASNEEGEGPCSDIFTFTTQRALPTALKAPRVSNISDSSCLIEWASAKTIGDDMLSYKLQLGSKESEFRVIYTGIQTNFALQNLCPGTEYSARVAAVRHCSDGELPGALSPCTVFCTAAVPTPGGEQPARRVFSLLESLRDREPLTDQQWAVIILCGLCLLAVAIAIVCQQVLS